MRCDLRPAFVTGSINDGCEAAGLLWRSPYILVACRLPPSEFDDSVHKNICTHAARVRERERDRQTERQREGQTHRAGDAETETTYRETETK